MSKTTSHSHLLLAHGSHASDIGMELDGLCRELSERLDGATVKGAFLSVGNPTFSETVAELVAGGAVSIHVQPLFLFSGKHSREDMPRLEMETQERYPEVAFSWSPLLPGLEGFADFLAEALYRKA